MSKRFWRAALPQSADIDLVTCGERDWKDAGALLARAYVTDGSGRFGLAYDEALLRWILDPPGQPPEWIIGARDRDWKLVGFISAARAVLRIDGVELPHAIVNLLSIDDAWRRRGLAALLIEDLTERVVARGITRALFTGSIPLAMPPFTTAPLFTRLLAPRELLGRGFVQRPAVVSDEEFVERHAVVRVDDAHFRRMRESDLAAAAELFARVTEHVRVVPRDDQATLRHSLLREPARAYVLTGDDDELLAAAGLHPLPVAIRAGGTIPAVSLSWLACGPQNASRLFEQLAAAAARDGFHLLNVVGLLGITETLIALRYLPTSGSVSFHLYDDREDCTLRGVPADVAVFPL